MEWLTGLSTLTNSIGGLGGNSTPAVPAAPPISIGGLTVSARPRESTLSRDILTGVVVVVLGGIALAYIREG